MKPEDKNSHEHRPASQSGNKRPRNESARTETARPTNKMQRKPAGKRQSRSTQRKPSRMKWFAAAAIVFAVAAAAGLLMSGRFTGEDQSSAPAADHVLLPADTLYLWYTDEALEDYLASAALDFSEERNVRVIPVLASGLEYMESIHDASLKTQTGPDLYVVSNDALEKAWLSGLASQVKDDGFVSTANFPEPAVHAVTYKDRIIGYPFYYETSALVYNKTYMESLAQAGEETETQTESSQPDTQQLDDKIDALIPTNLDNILAFADSYDAPEQVEAVFKWDVADIFYNYFFVGCTVNVGGVNGDNTDEMDIYNIDSIKSLMAYQNLNQFFSIEADSVDYESVIQEFIDGKLVFTVATTDVIARIAEAQKAGQFTYDYGITTLPDINETLKTRSISVTNAVVINGYSPKKELANQFAAYLTGERAAELYSRSGRMPSTHNVAPESEQAAAFMKEYGNSVPMPKMMAASNYWVQMEIAFTRIWSGEGVSDTLKALSEQIMTQITGEEYTERYIDELQEDGTETEYQD